MKIHRKEFVDQVLEIVVVWPFVAALWGALLLAGGQVLYWLKFDVVPNLDLVWVLNRLNLEVPRFSWAALPTPRMRLAGAIFAAARSQGAASMENKS
jgi:hypothetical protein